MQRVVLSSAGCSAVFSDDMCINVCSAVSSCVFSVACSAPYCHVPGGVSCGLCNGVFSANSGVLCLMLRVMLHIVLRVVLCAILYLVL